MAGFLDAVAFLVVLLAVFLVVGLPVVLARRIGRRKGRPNAWIWVLLLGVLGFGSWLMFAVLRMLPDRTEWVEAPSSLRRCPACGEIASDARRCRFCGEALSGGDLVAT